MLGLAFAILNVCNSEEDSKQDVCGHEADRAMR